MNQNPLYLALLWHMHQPFYKDLAGGRYIQPWVRLHAIKDYYDMATLLKGFPSIKQTFNFVPALLVQLEEYRTNHVKEVFLELTAKKASDLSLEEKLFLLENFFLANWDNMIKPYPRYWELLRKREASPPASDLSRSPALFSTQDYLDLQVWFNLAWCGPTLREDRAVKSLIQKDRYFSEADKSLLLSKQKNLIGKIIPLYKDLLNKRQIDISVSPFYHPILPLLYSLRLGKISNPNTPVPAVDFRFPQDIETQVNLAIAYHKKLFGVSPKGMWPSEGSVAEEIVPILSDLGIKWIASDDKILTRSLGASQELKPHELHRPYKATKAGRALTVFFRNHYLSDQIGFVYSKWEGEEAAKDFISKLEEIRRALPDDGSKYVVSVILDGENAWEHYPNNGKEFLTALYKRLSDSRDIRTITLSEFIEPELEIPLLPHLYPGSWIDGDFHIWVGHPEKNKAWEYLYNARHFLEERKNKLKSRNLVVRKAAEKAWQSVFIAEGSDWFWWYGDDHFSETSDQFDFLFRQHLKNIYSFMQSPPPAYLNEPIKKRPPSVTLAKAPSRMISPTLDGKDTNYYEWIFAGCYKTRGGLGTMHQTAYIIDAIYFGYDLSNLFLRLDTNKIHAPDDHRDVDYIISFIRPRKVTLELKRGNPGGYRLFLNADDARKNITELNSFGVGRIIELAIPLDVIGVHEGAEIEFRLGLFKDNKQIEEWPRMGAMKIKFAPKELEENDWSV